MLLAPLVCWDRNPGPIPRLLHCWYTRQWICFFRCVGAPFACGDGGVPPARGSDFRQDARVQLRTVNTRTRAPTRTADARACSTNPIRSFVCHGWVSAAENGPNKPVRPPSLHCVAALPQGRQPTLAAVHTVYTDQKPSTLLFAVALASADGQSTAEADRGQCRWLHRSVDFPPSA